MRGVAIPTPIGKPDEEAADEYTIRMKIFNKALDALQSSITEQTVFEVE